MSNMIKKSLLLILSWEFAVILTVEARTNADKETSSIKTFTAEWKTNGAVTKLYDTPVGEVFKFSLSPRFSNLDRSINDKAIHSIQFELFKNSKERDEMLRFIVMDLKIRVFPARSKIKNPNLFFHLRVA